MNRLPHVLSRTTNDASVKVHLMTGFKRSRRSSGHSKYDMLICRIVMGLPVTSKTDTSFWQRLADQYRQREFCLLTI